MPRKNKDFGRNQLAPAVHPDHPSEALHTLTKKLAWLMLQVADGGTAQRREPCPCPAGHVTHLTSLVQIHDFTGTGLWTQCSTTLSSLWSPDIG